MSNATQAQAHHELFDELDDAAARFHDDPCYATADRYAHIAIDYAANMIITMKEIKEIVKLVQPYLGSDVHCMVIGELE
jgi:hypothetical protein